MPTEDTLRDIISSAVYAPSGDNSQPWEFKLQPGEISIYNRPEADQTLYNFKQRGSFVGHGALIENIALLSAQKGYGVSIELFPDAPNCVARLCFTPEEATAQPLTDVLKERTTNRKPYALVPLKPEHQQVIEKSVEDMLLVKLRLITESTDVQKMGRVLSLNERLLMENRPLHDFLFSIIRFTPTEERKNPGLYIKTMELPPPVRFLFTYVLHHWSIVSFLNRLNFGRLISSQTASLYGASSAIGCIVIPSNTDAEYIMAGRALQRVWLTATVLGMSLQPVAAIPYLAERIAQGEAGDFSGEHVEAITQADSDIRKLAGISSTEHIAMIFRLGYADAPSGISSKRPPILRL